jgi:PHP family Zn ribbon phosphoesterase
MPNKGNQHKGRCQKCKVAYSWTGGPRLKDAKCPKCGGGLSWVSWDEGGFQALKEGDDSGNTASQ